MRRRAAAPWRSRCRTAVTAMAPVLVLPAVLLGGSSVPPPAAQPGGPAPRELGVSGTLPESPRLSPRILAEVGDPQRPTAPPAEELPSGDLDIPEPVLAAYVGAARRVAERDPGCGLDWSVLASIGRIESGHARDGAIDADGNTTRAILGPRLSGGAEFAAIGDTDGARFDGDPVWDRAVGPMQFIPSTWREYAADGNDDGARNPHNVHDAAVAAGDYLCDRRGDLSDRAELARAVFAYNRSESYVRTVLLWADAYSRGVTPTPAEQVSPVGDVLGGARLPEVAPMPEPPPLRIPDPQALGVPASPPRDLGTAPEASPMPRPGPAPLPAAPPDRPPAASPGAPPAAPPDGQVFEQGVAPVPEPQGPSPSVPAAPPEQNAPAPAAPALPEPPAEPTRHQQTAPELTSPEPGPPEPSPSESAPAGSTPPGSTPPQSTPDQPAPHQPMPSQPDSDAPESPEPMSSTPSIPEPARPMRPANPFTPPEECVPAVLRSGEFVREEPAQRTDVRPGTTDPAAARPGTPVFTDDGACTVPDEWPER
ncbi:lytic transglycosylase domain-containing protein [Saccharopolyspora halophila]